MKRYNLFRSRFAALEAFADAKPEERTPQMLAAAQAELTSAGIILVPQSEGIESAADLQSHIDGLVNTAATATAEAEKATKALAELRGTRVVDDARATSDKREQGDRMAAESAEEKEVKQLRAEVMQMAHYQKVQRILKTESK